MYKKTFIYVVLIWICFFLKPLFAINAADTYTVDLGLSHYIPVVSASIFEEKINLLLDTGAMTSLVLKEDILKNIKGRKDTGKIRRYIDAGGKINILNESVIPQLKINDLILKNVLTFPYHTWGLNFSHAEKEENSTKQGHVVRSFHKSHDGVIGIEMFANKKVIFDYSNKKLVIFTGDRLPKPYNLKKWTKTNFNIGPEGLTITGQIDELKRPIKFILDTGATASILHVNTLKEIGIKKTSYTVDLLFGDFTSKDHFFQSADFQEPKVEGILGYNFFAHTLLYFDLLNECLYLG